MEIAKMRDGDSTRLHDHYRLEMESLRNTHDAQMRSNNERHAEEISRMEQRLRDQETTHKQALDAERQRRTDEEKRARAEIDRVRREERDEAERRVRDTKERVEERLKDQEKQHASELRQEKNNAETRAQSEISRLNFQLEHGSERRTQLEEDLRAAREEAERNKDPVAVIADWQKQAKAMNFKEDKGEDQGMMQLIGKEVGKGLGEARALDGLRRRLTDDEDTAGTGRAAGRHG